jgi:tetratricopeptide (TPR) repeat protein
VDRLEVPEGVRLVIGKRLNRLSEESRRILTTAAVIGRGFGLGLLEALESARPDAALDAVEEAERAHLVTAEGDDRDPRYRFVHELIRQTLAEGLSRPRRQRLHARIAEAMERVWASSLDKHATAIAHHLYRAGAAADSAKTLDYLVRAAEIAQRSSAYEDALSNLDNAVSLCEGATGQTLADLDEHRAGVLRSLGRKPEAVAAYEQASIELAESLQTYWRFWDYLGLASLRDARDEDPAKEDAFRGAIGCELPNPSSGVGAAFLFRARAKRGEASALDLLRDPRISMPVPGEPNRLGAYVAATCAAEGLASLGRIVESAAMLPAVEEFLDGGAEYAWLRSTRTAAGIAAACAREWSRSEEHHRAAIHHADTAPARIFQPVSREWYAAMLAARGDVDRARPMLAEALALYETIGMPGYARRASERLAAMHQ